MCDDAVTAPGENIRRRTTTRLGRAAGAEERAAVLSLTKLLRGNARFGSRIGLDTHRLDARRLDICRLGACRLHARRLYARRLYARRLEASRLDASRLAHLL